MSKILEANIGGAGIKEFIEDQIRIIVATKEWDVLALEVTPDHIHLFISTTPFESPTGIVKVYKVSPL